MWLIGRLTLDFANFPKENGKAIRGVCRQVRLCCVSSWGCSENSLVAIDGSKFKAVNNCDRNFTSAKLKRRMEEIKSGANRYLTVRDAADQEEPKSF